MNKFCFLLNNWWCVLVCGFQYFRWSKTHVDIKTVLNAISCLSVRTYLDISFGTLSGNQFHRTTRLFFLLNMLNLTLTLWPQMTYVDEHEVYERILEMFCLSVSSEFSWVLTRIFSVSWTWKYQLILTGRFRAVSVTERRDCIFSNSNGSVLVLNYMEQMQ